MLSRIPDVQDTQQIDPDILKAILDVSQVDRDELLLADSQLVGQLTNSEHFCICLQLNI